MTMEEYARVKNMLSDVIKKTRIFSVLVLDFRFRVGQFLFMRSGL